MTMGKPKGKGEHMPGIGMADYRRNRRHSLGFVITRYVINASTKKAAQEADDMIADAKRQAETMRKRRSSKQRTRLSNSSRKPKQRTRSACARCALPRTASPSARNPLDRRVESLDAREHQLSSLQGQVERRERDVEEARECHRAPSRGGPDRPAPSSALAGMSAPGGQERTAGDHR